MKAGKKRRAKLPKWSLSRFDALILQYRTDAESVAGLVHRITIAKNPTGFLFRGRSAYRDADS